MNYCVDYYKKTKDKKNLLECANEITIPYTKQEGLIDLLQQFTDKRINLELVDREVYSIIDQNGLELEKIKLIHEKYPELNLYLKIPENSSLTLDKIKEIGLPYFYAKRVNDLDILSGMLAEGVSDVYLVDVLCFDLAKLASEIHRAGARVRVYPNVAQSEWKDLPGILKFFIRPEDLSYYENFVDIIEFFGETGKEDILYDIYFKDKKWFGQLNEIIIGLNSEIDNRFITQNFAEMRTKCGKRCLKGARCQHCQHVEELALTLKNNNYIIKEKEKKENGERTN